MSYNSFQYSGYKKLPQLKFLKKNLAHNIITKRLLCIPTGNIDNSRPNRVAKYICFKSDFPVDFTLLSPSGLFWCYLFVYYHNGSTVGHSTILPHVYFLRKLILVLHLLLNLVSDNYPLEICKYL